MPTAWGKATCSLAGDRAGLPQLGGAEEPLKRALV